MIKINRFLFAMTIVSGVLSASDAGHKLSLAEAGALIVCGHGESSFTYAATCPLPPSPVPTLPPLPMRMLVRHVVETSEQPRMHRAWKIVGKGSVPDFARRHAGGGAGQDYHVSYRCAHKQITDMQDMLARLASLARELLATQTTELLVTPTSNLNELVRLIERELAWIASKLIHIDVCPNAEVCAKRQEIQQHFVRNSDAMKKLIWRVKLFVGAGPDGASLDEMDKMLQLLTNGYCIQKVTFTAKKED